MHPVGDAEHGGVAEHRGGGLGPYRGDDRRRGDRGGGGGDPLPHPRGEGAVLRPAGHAAPVAGTPVRSVTMRWQRAASGPLPPAAGASPRSRPRQSAGSGRSVPASGSPSARATSVARSRPGAGPRTTTDSVGAVRDGRGHHPGRGRGGAQLGRDDDERVVGRLQRDHGGVVQLPGQVDHHEVATPSGGVDGRRHRRGGQRLQVAAVPGEHHQVTPAGQGPHQRRRVDPSVGAGERRPAQPFQLLPAEHQVEATAQRVGVDQQGAQPGPGGSHGEPAGEHARPGAAAPAEQRDDPGAGAVGVVRPAARRTGRPATARRRAGWRRARRRSARRPASRGRVRRLGRPARAGAGAAAGPAGTAGPGRRRAAPAGRAASGYGRRPGRRRAPPRSRRRRRGGVDRRAGRRPR